MAKAKRRKTKTVSLFEKRRSKALRGKQPDGRTTEAKFLTQTYQSLCAELGGEAELSFQQRILADQAAWQLGRLIHMRTVAAEKGSYDDDRYTRLNASLMKILQTLGLERKAKKMLSAQELIARESPMV